MDGCFFWYRLTRVDKGPLNGRVFVCVNCLHRHCECLGTFGIRECTEQCTASFIQPVGIM